MCVRIHRARRHANDRSRSSHHHRPRLLGLFEEKMFATRRALQGLLQSGWKQPEIKKARSGDLHLLANVSQGDLLQDPGPRLQLPEDLDVIAKGIVLDRGERDEKLRTVARSRMI